ncbi:acetoacetate decarboxylase family protein [Sphingobium sp. Sx8-8]|uniref:acetoacetate decarboxylase family protein n=1 Tax=Sphingobium sp. Sx8-8 TaxID=2933617 RepID=UPI001F5A7821|nr:acetoacetate decarboxylase family protein [Sphingobium sp. Sx8-8]
MSDAQRPFPGGILNLTGCRPGEAFQYDGLSFPDMTIFMVFFESSYEAIEKLILPPPLKADRSFPPEVQMWYFSSRNTLPMDGRILPYQGFQFRARTEHAGVKGSAGWEYIDGLYGDKTAVDIMGPWGVYFGMLKKFGDIRFIPLGVDEYEMSVTRRGVRLVTMRMKIGQELGGDALAQMNDGSAGETLTVREVPNIHYDGFVDRAICSTNTGVTNQVLRAWTCCDASVTFGHLELDPLDELLSGKVTNALAFNATASVETFTEMRILEELPREVARTRHAVMAD